MTLVEAFLSLVPTVGASALAITVLVNAAKAIGAVPSGWGAILALALNALVWGLLAALPALEPVVEAFSLAAVTLVPLLVGWLTSIGVHELGAKLGLPGF